MSVRFYDPEFIAEVQPAIGANGEPTLKLMASSGEHVFNGKVPGGMWVSVERPMFLPVPRWRRMLHRWATLGVKLLGGRMLHREHELMGKSTPFNAGELRQLVGLIESHTPNAPWCGTGTEKGAGSIAWCLGHARSCCLLLLGCA